MIGFLPVISFGVRADKGLLVAILPILSDQDPEGAFGRFCRITSVIASKHGPAEKKVFILVRPNRQTQPAVHIHDYIAHGDIRIHCSLPKDSTVAFVPSSSTVQTSASPVTTALPSPVPHLSGHSVTRSTAASAPTPRNDPIPKPNVVVQHLSPVSPAQIPPTTPSPQPVSRLHANGPAQSHNPPPTPSSQNKGQSTIKLNDQLPAKPNNSGEINGNSNGLHIRRKLIWPDNDSLDSRNEQHVDLQGKEADRMAQSRFRHSGTDKPFPPQTIQDTSQASINDLNSFYRLCNTLICTLVEYVPEFYSDYSLVTCLCSHIYYETHATTQEAFFIHPNSVPSPQTYNAVNEAAHLDIAHWDRSTMGATVQGAVRAILEMLPDNRFNVLHHMLIKRLSLATQRYMLVFPQQQLDGRDPCYNYYYAASDLCVFLAHRLLRHPVINAIPYPTFRRKLEVLSQHSTPHRRGLPDVLKGDQAMPLLFPWVWDTLERAAIEFVSE